MEKDIPVNQKCRWNSTEMRFVLPPDLSPISSFQAGVVSLHLESIDPLF